MITASTSVAVTHWRGRPLASMAREDLLRTLREVLEVKSQELPPMVPGPVYAPLMPGVGGRMRLKGREG